jgi:hypothetical protein
MKIQSGISVMTCVLLLAALTASLPAVAAVVYTETFADAAGWTGPGFNTFSHQPAGGNPGGHLVGSLSGGFSPQSGTFFATNGAANASFFGNLAGRIVSFDIFSDTLVPFALSFRFVGGSQTGVLNFVTSNLTTGQWETLSFALNYDSHPWTLPGDGASFMDAVENVASMEIILLQTSQTASTYRLDNFAVTTAIPEPGHSVLMLIGFGMIMTLRNRAGALLTLGPVSGQIVNATDWDRPEGRRPRRSRSKARTFMVNVLPRSR